MPVTTIKITINVNLFLAYNFFHLIYPGVQKNAWRHEDKGEESWQLPFKCSLFQVNNLYFHHFNVKHILHFLTSNQAQTGRSN